MNQSQSPPELVLQSVEPLETCVHERPSPEPSRVTTDYPRFTWAKVLALILIAAIGLGAAFAFGMGARRDAAARLAREGKEAREAPARVSVVVAEACEANRTLALPGECRAQQEATVFARTGGYLKELRFDIGDEVQEGQVLAFIDAPELAAMVKEAGARIATEEAEVRLARSSAEYASATLARYEAAAPGHGVSRQELEEKAHEQRAAEARIAAARAKVELGQAELEKLETLVRFQTVIAPFEGTITRRFVDVGTLISEGGGSGATALCRVERVDPMRVVVDVPQRFSTEVEVGAEAVINPQGPAGLGLAGRVERTSEAIDSRSGTLRVEVLVANPQRTLMPGMQVTTALRLRGRYPTVRIPSSALAFRTKGPHVATISPDNRVVFRPVKIARDTGDFIEVAEGIAVGEVVALNLSTAVREGDPVLPVPQERSRP